MSKPVASSGKPASLVLLLLLACALLCSGCGVAAVDELPPPLKIVREVRHENGLTVGVPEGFDASWSSFGFGFSPVENRNLELRVPVYASVSVVPKDMPAHPLMKSKTLGGRELRYRVIKYEGGSGGETYTLRVFERVQGGHVQYEQATQSETGEPDFALCWTLVGSAKYQPGNN